MRNWLFLIGLLLCSGYGWADDDSDSLSQASTSHWWSGISFTPGIGLRHLESLTGITAISRKQRRRNYFFRSVLPVRHTILTNTGALPCAATVRS